MRSHLTSAELYDPATGTWSATANMFKPHAGFPATLLRDGKVLVGDVDDGDANHPSYGAELYDPTSGTWTSTGSLDAGGLDRSATLLANGKVLVDGGTPPVRPRQRDLDRHRADGRIRSQFNYTATLLSDGRVLVVGGEFPSVKAQLYDPDTGSWTATADMRERLQSHDGDRITATLLRDDTVLVTGRGKSELYDPATGTWTATREQPKRDTPGVLSESDTATLLLDGSVLLAGPDGAELYDPTTGSWTLIGSKPCCDYGTSATLLLDGTVLMAGGVIDRRRAQSAAELYVPAGVSLPPAVVALPTPAPTPTPSPTPFRRRSRRRTRPRPVPSRRARGPGGHGQQREFRARDVVPGGGQRGRPGRKLCGSVTPNVVPAGVTAKVTFLLPPKQVTDCWIWINPVPGQGGSMFGTSDAPLAGEFHVIPGEHGPQGAWLGQ